MKISFSFKLISSYIVIVLASFGLMAFFLNKNLEECSRRDITQSLVIRAELVANQFLPESLRAKDLGRLEQLIKTLSQKAGCRITIITKTGQVLADSQKTRAETMRMENHLSRPEVGSALSGVTGIDTHRSRTLKTDMLYVAVPVKDGGEIAGAVRLAMPLTAIEKVLATTRRTIFIGFFVALIFASILGWILASRTVSPVNRMIQTARSFGQGDFSRRVIGHTRDEIGELAKTLNSMAQRIEDMIREASAQNQKLAAVFNSMIEGVIVVDKSGHIVSMNPAIERIFGVMGQDARGKLFLEAIRNNDIAEIIGTVLKSGKVLAREITLILPVQGVFQVNAVPVFHHADVNGCLLVIHNITELRRLETMRKDFVANVSHELKTPLTSIKGFVETLLDGALDDKENNRAFLRIIQDHADRLNELVNDLLSLSHLESKDIILEKREVKIRELLQKVIRGFSAQLIKNGITVENALPDDLCIHADEARLEQVFTNLIDNAIKFNTINGFIKIRHKELPGAVKITVEDSGLGIPAQDVPRIFERFYRVDKTRSRELGGTGLGLSIVKHIVDLHGGAVNVDSVEGFGSLFHIILPR